MAQAALENEEEAALRWTPDGFLLWNPRGFGYRLGDTQMAPKLALVLPSNHSVGYWILAISWYIMTGDFLSHGGTSHHPFFIGMKTMKTIKPTRKLAGSMTCGIHLRPFHANHVDSSGGVSRNLSALRTSAASASAGGFLGKPHTHITRWCPGAPVFDKRSVGAHRTPMSRVGSGWWHIQLVWTNFLGGLINQFVIFWGAPPYCISSKITKKWISSWFNIKLGGTIVIISGVPSMMWGSLNHLFSDKPIDILNIGNGLKMAKAFSGYMLSVPNLIWLWRTARCFVACSPTSANFSNPQFGIAIDVLPCFFDGFCFLI